MTFGTNFFVAAGLAVASALGFGVAGRVVPLPEKVTWLIAFVVYLLFGVANTLYEYGGYWIILLPALYWLKAITQTTGALAIAVSIYSHSHEANISPHWYSLPTGASSLALLTQYVPAAYLQVTYLSIALSYFLYASKYSKEFKGNKLMVAPIAILIGTGILEISKIEPMGGNLLTANNISDVASAVAIVLFAAVLNAGGGLFKLKTK